MTAEDSSAGTSSSTPPKKRKMSDDLPFEVSAAVFLLLLNLGR